MYRSFVALCLLAASLMFAVPVSALPPDMEADRLILAAEEKLEQQDFEAARGYLHRVSGLEVAPGAKFYYLSGLVALHYGELDQSAGQLTRYVEAAGKEGEFYQEALRSLTKIEEQQASREAVSRSQDQMKAIRDNGLGGQDKAGQAYDAKVQKLYGAATLQESLVLHINSLLSSYPYLEGAIKNPQRSPRVEFQVATGDAAQITVMRREFNPTVAGQVALSSNSLDAFGVNPFVSYRCSKVSDQCVIRHPVSGADWIVIARDESTAQELATALTRLIKALQR